ncbi:YbaB/EbfC family nucleoid-associated protein [Actinomadura sp. 9N407]|uniref:YbaB/EbfC family nucleoid-associated protein n=1 Tax=Actinomadura sp. 9N407 TaxID=3375154 RepID=UPI003791D8D5
MFELDLEKMLKASEQHLADTNRLQERTAELIGRAESADGRVTVEWNGEGLHRIEIDPRAMRLGADQLSELIVETSREAKADLERRSGELMKEIFGEDGDPMSAVPDQEEMQSKMDELQDMFGDTMKDTTALLEQLRRTFEK